MFRTDIPSPTAQVGYDLLLSLRVSAVTHDLIHCICDLDVGHGPRKVEALVALA